MVTSSSEQVHKNYLGALTVIERILERLYRERYALLARSSAIPASIAPELKSGQATDQAARAVANLDRSIERLEKIRGWLTEDHQLLTLIDETINQRVRALERRRQRFDVQMALATTLGGALLGWLLAAISSPHDLLRLLGL